MTDRTNTHRGEASKKNQKKGGKRQNLQQYYADDMIEEDKKVPLNTQQRHLMMDEEEEEVEVINLEDNQSKERLNKENMDKISDILVSMIYKNKVNSKNAFDVPLPNVEHLTDFNQVGNDNSWKKLSQTLDAGAKIYGFRVDSVHNETYKVLGGLNRTELAEAVVEEMPEMEEEKEVIKKTRRDQDGENTLEKNLSNIDANKYDLEFDLDPLFQKTSAKFDEGGAKGLLLNNININSQINLMFDSGNVLENQKDSSETNPKRHKVTKAFFKDIQGIKSELEELLQFKLCPELTTFKNQYIDKSKDLNDLVQLERNPSQYMTIEEEPIDRLIMFDDVEIGEHRLKNETEQIPDVDMPIENYEMPNEAFAFHDEEGATIASHTFNENTQTSTTNGFVFNSKSDDPARELNFHNIEERSANLGAGKALDTIVNDHRNWMGPEAWKIKINKRNKIADNSDTQSIKSGKVEKDLRPKKKTTDISVDFNLSKKEKDTDIFGPKKKKASAKKTIEEEKSITFTSNANLILPMDFQVKTYRLNSLFLRSIDFKVHDREEIDNNELTQIDHSFQNIDEFGDGEPLDPQLQEELDRNLENFARKNSKDLEYDKTNRNVNIKALKESIWGYLEPKVPDVNHKTFGNDDEENGSYVNQAKHKSPKKNKNIDKDITFTEVCESIPGIIGNSKQKNVTVHSCFVTMLHLANEKGLRFVKEGEDFCIYKETN